MTAECGGALHQQLYDRMSVPPKVRAVAAFRFHVQHGE